MHSRTGPTLYTSTLWDHQRRPPGRLFYGSTSCPTPREASDPFTADNIVAILRALPETDGTYIQVVALATENGAQLSTNTLGKWITNGRADIQAGKSQTAYGRFSQRYDSIMVRTRPRDNHGHPLVHREVAVGQRQPVQPSISLCTRRRLLFFITFIGTCATLLAGRVQSFRPLNFQCPPTRMNQARSDRTPRDAQSSRTGT